jgi:hypothetical protein
MRNEVGGLRANLSWANTEAKKADDLVASLRMERDSLKDNLDRLGAEVKKADGLADTWFREYRATAERNDSLKAKVESLEAQLLLANCEAEADAEIDEEDWCVLKDIQDALNHVAASLNRFIED